MHLLFYLSGFIFIFSSLQVSSLIVENKKKFEFDKFLRVLFYVMIIICILVISRYNKNSYFYHAGPFGIPTYASIFSYIYI